MKLKTMIVVMLVFGFAIYQAQASERHPTAYTNVTSFEQSTLPPELEIVRFSSPEEKNFFAWCAYGDYSKKIKKNEQELGSLTGDPLCCPAFKEYLEPIYTISSIQTRNEMRSLQEQYPFLLTVAPNKFDLNDPEVYKLFVAAFIIKS